MTNAVNIAGLGSALTVSSGVVNFSSTPTVAGSPIGASAATPTVRGTVWGSGDTGALGNQSLGYNAALNSDGVNAANQTAIGQGALQLNVTQSWNTAVGFKTLYNTTGGGNNTAFGGVALYSNTSGTNNTALGMNALFANTTASTNTAVGFQSLVANTTGTPNTAVGRALRAVTTGGQNVGIGDLSGEVLTTGTFNTFIGNNIDASSSSVSNAIVINAAGTKTDKGASTGYINPNTGGVYQGNNSSSWSTTSDFRLKKNIVDNNEGLDKISQIRVRNFEYRTAEEVTELPSHTVIDKQGVQLGVIAQELREICPDCVKEESTGVISVDSDNIFWHMVNAIKDLKALNDSLTARITALEAR